MDCCFLQGLPTLKFLNSDTQSPTGLFCAFVWTSERCPFPLASTAGAWVSSPVAPLVNLSSQTHSQQSSDASVWGTETHTLSPLTLNKLYVYFLKPGVHIYQLFSKHFFTDKIVRKRKPVCPKKDTNQQRWEHSEKPPLWHGGINWKGMYSVSGTAFRKRI